MFIYRKCKLILWLLVMPWFQYLLFDWICLNKQ